MKTGKEKKSQWIQERQIGGHLLKDPVMDYHVYEMTDAEKRIYSLIALVVGGFVGLIFYGGLFKVGGEATIWTWLANLGVFLTTGILAVVIFLPMRTEQLLEKRQKELRSQFRDMLQILTNSLVTGTVDRAFHSACKSMEKQYSKSAYITKELNQIDASASNDGIPLEDLLEDFAKRSGVEDIEDFSNVFKVTRRSGGNIANIMRSTHSIIGEKMEIEDEITSKMKSNQLELNVIMVSPFVIVAFLRFGNASFGERFTTPSGLLASTVGICLFIFAWYLGQKIVKSVR